MKAAVFDGVGQPLRVADLREPEPAPDEVLLRIAACGICGSDLHITEDPVTFGVGQGTVLGHEFAGEVIGLGTSVTGFAVGNRVAVAPMWGCGACASCLKGDPAWCGQMRLIGGGYAEVTAVAARQCRRLPDDLPLEEGALAEPVAVGLHAVMRSGMKPGDTVLILGAGPIGLVTAFWARRLGAGAVIVADLNRHQEARAAAVGATGFAISGPGLGAEVPAMIGAKPDIVFECVGKRGLIDAACRLVRVHGTVVAVGLCVGGDDWDPFAALSKEISVVFAVFFSMAEFATAIDALGPGRFRPQSLITDRIGFAAVPDTFEALRKRTTQCKVLIAPDAGHRGE
jgi:threonine dehydrogenase-like Zn-dependent dehydrogenase